MFVEKFWDYIQEQSIETCFEGHWDLDLRMYKVQLQKCNGFVIFLLPPNPATELNGTARFFSIDSQMRICIHGAFTLGARPGVFKTKEWLLFSLLVWVWLTVWSFSFYRLLSKNTFSNLFCKFYLVGALLDKMDNWIFVLLRRWLSECSYRNWRGCKWCFLISWISGGSDR